jgi:predicted component of type VI protein secretion system
MTCNEWKNMYKAKVFLIAAILLALSACDESGKSEPASQQFTLTLTAIDAVKQGSDEAVPIDGTPVEGATLTLAWP